jgi:membrane-associated phospholipid phosphatase
MPNRISCSKGKWIFSALLLTPLLALCVRFLDIPVALYVKHHLYGNLHWAKLTSNLPDLLLVAVLLVTCTAFSLYLARTSKGIYDAATSFEKLVSWAAPTSYLVKSLFKFVFGRVNTRHWLEEPDLYGFHWFQSRAGCDGFPSGHMIVVVTLLAALWRFHPRSRPFCGGAALLLGVALIATNYHFLSDVIAGAYLGMATEAVVFCLLFRWSQRFVSPV